METKITIVICLILFLVGCFVGYKYVYIPQMEQIEEKKANLGKEIEKNYITYNIRKLENELENYAKHFPEIKDSSKFISEITDKVKRADLEVLSITPQRIKDYKNYSILPVRLHLKSNFHKLGEFISILESSGQYIGVNYMELNKLYESSEDSSLGTREEQEDRKGNVVSGVTFDLNTFVFKSIK